MSKTGRNDPCPCGSGKKFKKCCGVAQASTRPPISTSILKQMKSRLEAQEKQREQQQGKGRPIISAEMNGIRFVAVGNQLHYSDKWKTFHDFLFAYLTSILDQEIGNDELRKPLQERHPIAQWYHHLCLCQQQTIKVPGKVSAVPALGAVSAYLELAYNLYLLAHNEEIHNALLKRLLHKEQFRGAYYETFVAASLIKAGCDLEFENETDSSRSHCEFTATFRTTHNRYSIEAKARQPGKPAGKIGGQLYNALCKQADGPRVVFIDINVPDPSTDLEKAQWFDDAMQTLREKENTMTIAGQPAPPAYVFVSNYPYEHCLHSSNYRCAIFAEGFKIPGFKDNTLFPSIRAVLSERERHVDMFALLQSFRTHHGIPVTFDAEIPAFAFGSSVQRLLIGEKYLLPGENGTEIIGELIDAVVAEKSGLVYGFYKIEAGNNVICTCPLTADELAAYKQFPDTFFGVDRPQGKNINDRVKLFDWFFSQYQKCSKEGLLNLMRAAADIEALKNMDQKELAITYCERLVLSFPMGKGSARTL